MRPAELRRLRGRLDAAWRAEVAGEVERILAMPDPAGRMAAHAELSRTLAEEGDGLPPDATDRIFRSLRLDAEAVERERRRREREAERAEAARLDRLRPWALGLGLPLAAVLPCVAAAIMAGWGALDVLVAVLELPWLVGPPLVFCAAAVVALGVFAWLTARASTAEDVAWWLGCVALCGVALLAGAKLLPVYRATDAARFADGSGIGGGLVRVEEIGPGPAERIHVLRGAGRASRGQTIAMPQGGAVRWLRGS